MNLIYANRLAAAAMTTNRHNIKKLEGGSGLAVRMLLWRMRSVFVRKRRCVRVLSAYTLAIFFAGV